MKNLAKPFYDGEKKFPCHPDYKEYKKKVAPGDDESVRQFCNYFMYVYIVS